MSMGAGVRARVAVTGVGVVSPIGIGYPAFREALVEGASGVGAVTLFDPAELPTRFAAEVPLRPEELAFRDRKVDFALRAAEEAVRDAGSPEGDGAGVALGLGLELFSLSDLVAGIEGPLPVSTEDRLQFLQTPSDLCLHSIGVRHGLTAPPITSVSACAAGADAIGTAFRMVASGRRRWMLAGGSDSMVNPMGLGGFCRIQALSTRNDDPAGASRPFDRGRDGFVLGEGAAVLVLERLEDARARGVRVRAEVVGYGSSLDAGHISRPHPEGRGALQSMRRALEDANLGPDRVDVVNAHGTSTPLNDVVEARAIRALLGERTATVPVSAPKSQFGHLVAAAGAIEAAAAIAGLEKGVVPPIRNLTDPDPECDLDLVAGPARRHRHEVVLSNSFGFGGQNASLVLRRVGGAE
jgi:3-oxoacyl-[acyl-carrier-protein] synthase II